MNTNKLLVFLAGAAVAYFVLNQINKQKLIVPVAPIDGQNPNLAACEKALTDSMMTLRFGSAEEMQKYKDDFMADCLQNPANYLTMMTNV